MGLLINALFVLMVALPTALHIRELPDRVSDIREGAAGALAVPLVLAVLLPLAVIAGKLSAVPVLGWGWLGHNIAMQPLTGSPGGGGGAAGAAAAGGGLAEWAFLVTMVALIALAMVIFNYIEEELFRGSWRATGLWAALHALMGIPLIFVMPIFGAGVVYKKVHDRWGLETAYVAHLATNMTILGLAVLSGFLS